MTISNGTGKLFPLLSWLILLVGCCVLAAMAIGPAGVWLKWWLPATALGIVGAIHPWAAVMAVAALVLGLFFYALGRQRQTELRGLFLSLHLGVALACAVAWYVPLSYLHPEISIYPPIHDISTDLVDIPQFIAVIPQRIDAPTIEYGRAPGMTPELNAQLQREAYPDVVTQYYDASPSEMYYRAYSAAFKMKWALATADEKEGRIEATATTFWFRFKEDVVIRIRDENGMTRVDARSLSRVDGGDGGSNARRLRKFFEIL